MNAKKAKALRKAAQAMTVGAERVQYEDLIPSVVGLPTQTAPFLGQLTLTATCTRSVYQRLKRGN